MHLESILDPAQNKSIDLTAKETATYLAENPNKVEEAVQLIYKQIFGLEIATQLNGLRLLAKMIDIGELPFHTHVSHEIMELARLLQRKDLDNLVKRELVESVKIWESKFENLIDILPGFHELYLYLVSEGIIVTSEFKSLVTTINRNGGSQLIDSQLMNDAEGQDPDEFILEVESSVKLFDDVSSRPNTSEDRNQALISLAINLDRYLEQLEVWIELLETSESGEYLEKAKSLLGKLNDRLNKYRNLRIS
jgi:hypothetical protein